MKTTRSHLPLLLLLFLIPVEYSFAQTQVGISAAANFSNAYIEDDVGNTYDTQFVRGLRIGLTFDVPLFGVFNLQPAAFYSQKGFEQDDNWFSGVDNEFKASVSYVEVPVNILYKSEWGKGNLLIGAGPYVAYGIGGQWETEHDIDYGGTILEKKGDVIFEKEGSDFEFGEYVYGRPLDYGANVLAGYDFWKAYSIQIQGQFGVNLQPLWNGVQRQEVFKNRSFNVSLGYKF